MSQPPSNSTLTPYSSTGSSARPSLGSFELISESQYHHGQGGGYGSNGGHMAVPESTEQFHPYMNLPSNVKLPPSYKQPEHPQEYRAPAQPPQPAPRVYTAPLQPPSVTVGGVGHAHVGGGTIHPGHSIETGVPMSEVVRQLDFAASENLRLRERLEYNNEVLDRKLQEIEALLRQKETDTQRMAKTVEGMGKTVEQKEKEKQEVLRSASEATQKFFEARVAVMGFKSRQMQLQGEVEGLRAEIARKNSGVQSSGAGPAAPVSTTQQELDSLKRENQQLQLQKQELLGRLQNGGIKEVDRTVEELRRQLSKLKQDKESLELNMTAVTEELRKDIMALQDKRSLDKDEIQRITTSATDLQQRVWSFQQDNESLRNRIGQQQVEMQRNVESLQNELMATKQQQFYQASSEVSQLRTSLQDSQSKISQLTAELGINQAENISLKAKVDEVNEKNKTLREKVNELKQMNDTFGQKLRQHSGPVTLSATTPPGSPPMSVRIKTAPIPRPRTNLQPVSSLQVEQLEKQKSDLEREKSELIGQLQRVSKLRETAESELHHSTTRTQQMIEENIRLKKSLEERDGMLSGQGDQVRRLEEDIRQLQVQLQAAPSPSELKQQQEQRDVVIQRLSSERTELQSRVATLERELSSKAQLEVEVNSLRGERAQMTELEFEMRKERAQKGELESELSSLRQERTQREDELALLRRKNAELEGSVTRLQELEKAKKPVTGRQNPETKLLVRLSDALGLQKELEKRNENLEEEKEKLKEEHDRVLKELEQEKQKHDHARRQSDQLHQSFQLIKEEKARLEQEELQRARSEAQVFKEDNQSLQEETQSLRDELHQATGERMQLRTQIDKLRQDLTQKGDCERQVKDLREQRDTFEHQLRELTEERQRVLTEHQQYEEQVAVDLEDKHTRIQNFEKKQQNLQDHYDQKVAQIEQLKLDNDALRQQGDQLQQEILILRASVGQKQQSHQQLEAEIQRLRSENREAEGTVREFRKECEALMNDYQASADRLHEAEAERDKYKNQYETALRELAQRAERIKQLEQQRKEATERNEHMSFQLKQYTEDFDRERGAREEAVKVKNIVEEQIMKKDREITSLRRQLNVHAQQKLKEEWDEPQLGGDGGRISPFTSPLGGGGGGGMGRHPQVEQELLPHKRSRPQQDPPFELAQQQPHPVGGRPFNEPPAFNRPPPPQPIRAWPPEQNVAGAGTFGGQERQFDQSRHTLHHPIPRTQPGVMGGNPGQQLPPPIPNQQPPIPRAQMAGMGEIRGQPGVMAGMGEIRGQPGAMGGMGEIRGQPGAMGGMGEIRGQPGAMGGMHGQLPRMDIFQLAPAPRNDLSMPLGGGGGGPRDGGQGPVDGVHGPGWAAPGDVVNEKPPSMACPICNKADFRTQTDLEVHCAQCTASLT